jgi:hypothetical protein
MEKRIVKRREDASGGEFPPPDPPGVSGSEDIL